MSKSILIIGNLCDGYRFVGTFDCHDDASEWAFSNRVNGEWWVATVETPDVLKEVCNDQEIS